MRHKKTKKRVRKNPLSIITVGMTALTAAAGWLIYRAVSSSGGAGQHDESIVPDQLLYPKEKPIDPKVETDSRKTPPRLILAGNKNYYKDNILCNNVHVGYVKVGPDVIQKQIYIPMEKPSSYSNPKPKRFKVSCPNAEVKLPVFNELIQPCSNPKGLIAYTKAERASNMKIIAHSFGKLNKQTDPIIPEDVPDVSVAYNQYLPSSALMKFLGNVLVKEVHYENTYESQREMVGILWCLVNRMTVGSTALKVRNEANFKAAVIRAISSRPQDVVPGSELDKESDCLIPMIKAFFMGFFNDETSGSTHWAHFEALGKRCPPIYYYPQGTTYASGNVIERHRLRAKSIKNYYIRECVYVRVNEALNGS